MSRHTLSGLFMYSNIITAVGLPIDPYVITPSAPLTWVGLVVRVANYMVFRRSWVQATAESESQSFFWDF